MVDPMAYVVVALAAVVLGVTWVQLVRAGAVAREKLATLADMRKEAASLRAELKSVRADLQAARAELRAEAPVKDAGYRGGR